MPRRHVDIEIAEEGAVPASASEPVVEAPLLLSSVALLPRPGDNCVVLVERVEKGTVFQDDMSDEGKESKRTITLQHTILVGHRLALLDIPCGETLTSWNYPFGWAIVDIKRGEYVTNVAVLKSLGERKLTFDLPAKPNFVDNIRKYNLDEEKFVPGKTVPKGEEEPDYTFEGYVREGNRGVGTRNPVVVYGTASSSGSFCRRLAEVARESIFDEAKYPNVDSIVSVSHTEGTKDEGLPNNFERLIRVLCGQVINPNIGAVLIVDAPVAPGTTGITNAHLHEFFANNPEHKKRLDATPHRFITLSGSFTEDLKTGQDILREFLPQANAFQRVTRPLSDIRVVLQCGGSDAFSGISGNPLSGYVAKKVVQHGGCAGMAETGELVGAEDYYCSNVKDLPTALKFLDRVEA